MKRRIRMMTPAWLLASLALGGWGPLQSPNKAIESGNSTLKAGKAEAALGHYDEAAKLLPAEPGVHFDRGAALFALDRYDEAAQAFLRATEAKTTPLKAAAFYNLGNTFFKAGKFADAVAAYRRSLVFNPGDMRAKWNLELALQKKKDEDDKKKQDEQKQDQKDKQDKQDKKDGKDQDKKDGKNEPQKNDQKPGQQDKQDQPQKPDDKGQDEKNQPPPPEDKGDKQDPQKPDEKPGEPKQDQPGGQQPQPQPPPEQPASGAEGTPPPDKDKASEMKEIEAVLDSLERSPKDLEQARAKLRAVRRLPPSKDW